MVLVVLLLLAEEPVKVRFRLDQHIYVLCMGGTQLESAFVIYDPINVRTDSMLSLSVPCDSLLKCDVYILGTVMRNAAYGTVLGTVMNERIVTYSTVLPGIRPQE